MKKFAASVLLALLPLAVLAQTWPDRPIQFIVQFPAGSSTDIVARDVAQRLGVVLKQTVVVVNKPGASGTIGVNAIAAAKPDGYAIGTVNLPALAIVPHLQKVPYDPMNAFTHLAVVGPYDYGIFVLGSSPWKTLPQLVDYVRKNPDKSAYGTLGTGTTNQLVMQKISSTLKLGWAYVPYKGDSESLLALLAGDVQAINASPAAMLTRVQSGELRMLVSTGQQRWFGKPDVPTLQETGLVNFAQNSFISIAAPAKLDPVARQKLEQALRTVLTNPVVVAAHASKFGQTVAYQTGEAYATFVAKEYVGWAKTLAMDAAADSTPKK